MMLNRRTNLSVMAIIAGFVLTLFTIFSNQAFAETTSPTNTELAKPLLAIAAAIAIAGGLIGTGNAQQGIGTAGMGIIAEKPEKFGQVLFFFVIPETLWIIGFVLGIILLLGIL